MFRRNQNQQNNLAGNDDRNGRNENINQNQAGPNRPPGNYPNQYGRNQNRNPNQPNQNFNGPNRPQGNHPNQYGRNQNRNQNQPNQNFDGPNRLQANHNNQRGRNQNRNQNQPNDNQDEPNRHQNNFRIPRNGNHTPNNRPNNNSRNSHNRPQRFNENQRTPRNNYDNQENQNNDQRRDNILYFGFKRLKELSEKDSNDILTTLKQKEAEFKDLLLQKMASPDFVVLILQILTKVCRANFTEIVTSVLSHACSVNFLENLSTYLQKLAFETELEQMRNQLYHKDKDNFWSNLVEFFEKVVDLLPTKAREELTPVLCKVEQIIKFLETNKGYIVNDDVKNAISNMSIDLKEEIKKLEINKIKATTSKEIDLEMGPPPEDFRLLSIIPTQEDLHDQIPYIRRCKVKDAYDSVDHYLDVQFRLLREDFISPLRAGIKEYLSEDQKHRNRDLRVYKKVKLLVPEASKNSVGIVAEFGIIKNIKWQYSKRFMHGGLVLLSNDNFMTILFATIVNRDVRELEKGCILIEPCEGTSITQDMYEVEFVMLESKIYFEPYLAVLNAMQQMNEKNFPMEYYLVNAGTQNQLPQYLTPQSLLTYKGYNLPVGQAQYWPNAKQLSLDETQYNAFKCALTQEFSVIQGPPGCGKTFIALEIVSALLQNENHWKRNGPIVVVCLTNHALDQFLEGILKQKYTDSIVRIGSRSKSEILKQYTLMERRKLHLAPRNNQANKLMFDTKHQLEEILRQIEKSRLCVKYLTTPEAIVPLECLTKYCNNPELLQIKTNEELIKWLVGSNVTLLPVKETAIPKLIMDENAEEDPLWLPEDLEEDHTMDDELELDYDLPVNNTFKPIFPLKIIDAQIEKNNQDIFNIRSLLSEEMIKAQEVNPITRLEEHIGTLNTQQESLKRKLNKHSILSPPRYPVKNPQWKLYWDWVKLSHERAMKEVTELMTEYRRVRLELNDVKQLVDLATIREHTIVGLTTTGAAKLHSSLRALHAPIVLVEEAAEILEAHVVCSMTKHCQHVILIGDHKQLRPKASVYELGTKYNLNISLFERMVNIRGNCTQLAHQHRMRPQIAKLITPSIYETLFNHESVLNYPNVKGLVKNLFFLNHNNRESNHNNEESWVNKHEVDFLITFAMHLMKQGYSGADITILATYTGQLFAFSKEAQRYPVLKPVRITTIDNYQGEENKIILLSLVRNNEDGIIGFLKEENRVCVALSRAREGMYIMGNINNLIMKNTIWPKIRQVLEEEDAIGDYLELRCQIHSDQIIKVQNRSDFVQCPEGGCTKKCDADLPCGHSCTSVCHILDREHKAYKCKKPCIQKCPNEHPCPLRCYEGCKPCQVTVERKLNCGHTVKMPCSSDPKTFPCYIEVRAILPDCQHEIKKQCHHALEKCKCPHPCENRLPCGHQCRLICHVNEDPDHIEYRCFKECPKKNINCVNDHPCKKRCFEECEKCFVLVEKKRSCGHINKKIQCSVNIEEQPCTKPCKLKLDCGHPCKEKCSEKCGNCQVMVAKKSDCGHIINVECCEQATSSMCKNRCPKKLACGHPCTTRCEDRCTTRCEEKVLLRSVSRCGHQIAVPCYLKETDPKSVQLLQYCEKPCMFELKCSHYCKGTCGKCKQGRIHIPCAEPCNNILVCGHACNTPCRTECRPCNKQCELRCPHSKCTEKCGMPCSPCQEECDFRCEHRECTKKCSEPCNVEPCDKPCKKKLKCGHPCVGFCGDPCPPLCRICHNEELTEILFGDEDEPEARFIYLEDCKHCIESNGLMTWVINPPEQNKKSIQIKTCPKCKTPIRKCLRLKNQIKKDFDDIQLVKTKVFGDQNELKNQQLQYLKTLENMTQNQELREIPELRDLLRKLLSQATLTNKQKRQKLCNQEIDAFKIILELLEQVFQAFELVTNFKTDSYNLTVYQIAMLVDRFPTKWQISQQEINDIQLEIRRLHYMTQFGKVEAQRKSYLQSGLGFEYEREYNIVFTKLVDLRKFNLEVEAEIKKYMSMLCDFDKYAIAERKMIVKAMGFKQGHWFKCPNGHPYTIGECGGAMELSKCPECKAPIGGGQHRLTAGNALASEMDGATASAWPGNPVPPYYDRYEL